jgi:hydroxyacylglutathione hydrolase
MNYRRSSPVLHSLFAQGAIATGPHGFGLWINEAGALRDQAGTFSSVLFHVGPGRQGTLLESIAIPELRQQAADLAAVLDEMFAARENDGMTDEFLEYTQPTTVDARVDYELAS